MIQAIDTADEVALILLARLPRAGTVKTRLAADVGDDNAAAFYRHCAERIIRESRQLSNEVRLYLFYADEANEECVRRWVGDEFHLRSQIGGDIGDRMEHAFATVFDHGVRKALVVGTDIPELSADILRAGFCALDAYDVVLGPTYDGGYYLLGIRAMHHALFTDMPWSTELVFDRTMAVIDTLGLSCHVLPRLIDIDTEDDLRRWYVARTGMPYDSFAAGLRELAG